MRLYQKMETTEGETTLIQTDDIFKNSKDFIAYIKKHGKNYEGKTWVLLSERTKQIPITVKAVTQYEIELPVAEKQKA